MSVKIMTAVFDSKTLGPTERLVMLALAHHADDEGRCYPSVSRLCERTGLSERAIQTNIKALVASGHLTVRPNAGPSGVNVYIVHQTPAACAPRTNDTPQEMHPAGNAPRSRCVKPPQQVHPNHQEPSLKKEKRAGRIPEQWEPTPEGFALGVSEGLTPQDVWREADKFRDYWRSKAGRDGTKLNWDATWRNWIRKASDDRKSRTRSKQPSDDPTLRAIARAAGAFEASPVDWPSGRGAA